MTIARSIAGAPAVTRSLLLLVLVLSAPLIHAAEAVVHGIQSPAWIERTDRIIALRPGFSLSTADVIRTGRGGRIELDLADGSRFQVGESAELAMDSLAMSRDAQGEFFDSAMRVLKGAFRFTTRAIGGDRRRSLRIQTGTATIGIRGTDVWGIVREDGSDTVVLLEGSIEITMPDQVMTMATPLMAMHMTATEHSEHMMTGPEIAPFAAMTDMRPDAAMMMMEGTTVLAVMSLSDRRYADALVTTLERAGYPASVVTVDLPFGTFHRVVLDHLLDSHHAQMLADELIGEFGITEAWVVAD
jgi:hypothetical protein